MFHRNLRKRGARFQSFQSARKTTTLGPSRGPFHSFHRQNSSPFKSSSGFEMFESEWRIHWDILGNICGFNDDAYLILSTKRNNWLLDFSCANLLEGFCWFEFYLMISILFHYLNFIHAKIKDIITLGTGLVGPALQVAQLHDLQCAVDGRRDLDVSWTGQSVCTTTTATWHHVVSRHGCLSFVPSGRQQGYSVALGDIPWDTAQASQIVAVVHKPISPSTSIVTGLIQGSIVSCTLALSIFIQVCVSWILSSHSLVEEKSSKRSQVPPQQWVSQGVSIIFAYHVLFNMRKCCSERSIIDRLSSLGSGHGNAKSDGHLIAHHARERRECPSTPPHADEVRCKELPWHTFFTPKKHTNLREFLAR